MKEKELYDDDLLESLVEDVREFADGLESPEEGAAYSVKKVKDAITGGVSRPVWDAALKDRFRNPFLQQRSTFSQWYRKGPESNEYCTI